MSSRSVAKVPGSNSDSSWLSSHVLYCGTVTVYQCYMACFITVTGRPLVGCKLVMIYQAYYKATELNDEFLCDRKLELTRSFLHNGWREIWSQGGIYDLWYKLPPTRRFWSQKKEIWWNGSFNFCLCQTTLLRPYRMPKGRIKWWKDEIKAVVQLSVWEKLRLQWGENIHDLLMEIGPWLNATESRGNAQSATHTQAANSAVNRIPWQT